MLPRAIVGFFACASLVACGGAGAGDASPDVDAGNDADTIDVGSDGTIDSSGGFDATTDSQIGDSAKGAKDAKTPTDGDSSATADAPAGACPLDMVSLPGFCMDRYEARKAVVAQLERDGFLVKAEPHLMMLPRSGRTGVVVEPMLTDQWFVRMDGLAKQGLDAVAKGDVKFFPEHWASTYNHWLENIQDWCISRQLWWGHQIPAWHTDGTAINGEAFVVARSEEEAYAKARGAGPAPAQA